MSGDGEKGSAKWEESRAARGAAVRELEGDSPLDEAVEAFERGIALSKACMQELNKEKGKLRELVDDLNKLTEEFDIDAAGRD